LLNRYDHFLPFDNSSIFYDLNRRVLDNGQTSYDMLVFAGYSSDTVPDQAGVMAFARNFACRSLRFAGVDIDVTFDEVEVFHNTNWPRPSHNFFIQGYPSFLRTDRYRVVFYQRMSGLTLPAGFDWNEFNFPLLPRFLSVHAYNQPVRITSVTPQYVSSFTSGAMLSGQCLPLTVGTSFQLCRATIAAPVAAYRYEHRQGAQNCQPTPSSGTPDLSVSYTHGTTPAHGTLNLQYTTSGDQTSNSGLFAPGYWRISGSGYSVVFACLDANLARNTQTGQDDVSVTATTGTTPTTTYRCADTGTDARVRRTINALGTTATLTYLGTQPQQPVYAPLTASTTFNLCRGTIAAQVRAFRYEQRAQPATCDTATAEGLSELAVSYTHGTTASGRAIALAYTTSGDQTSNSGLFAPGYWRISGSGYSAVFACLDINLARNTQPGQDDVSVTASADGSSTTYRCVDTGVDARVRRTFAALGDTVTLTYLGAQAQQPAYAPLATNTRFSLCQGTITAQVPAFRYEQRAQPSTCDTASAEGLSELAVSYTHGTTANNRTIALAYTVEGDQSSNAVSFAPGYWRIAGSNYSVVFACLDINHASNTQPGQDDVSVTTSADGSSTTYRCVDTGADARVRRTFDSFGSTATLTYLGTQAQDSVYVPSVVDLVGLEITQGTQDLEGNVRLVRNRPTAVRAFFEVPSGEVIVQAQLTARIDTTNPEPVTTGSLNPRGSVRVAPNVLTREAIGRGDIDSSLNFILPNSWTNLAPNQTLHLTIRPLDGVRVNCRAPNTNRTTTPATSCAADVTFTTITPPTIVMVPIRLQNPYEPAGGGNFTQLQQDTPDVEELRTQFRRIQAMIPLPEQMLTTPVNRQFRTLQDFLQNFGPFTQPAAEEAQDLEEGERNPFAIFLTMINDRLRDLRLDSDILTDIYLGVVPEHSPGTPGVAASIPGASASWYISGVTETPNDIPSYFGELRNAGAHELGHALGLYHPRPRNEQLGVCGEDNFLTEYEHFDDPYPATDDDPYEDTRFEADDNEDGANNDNEVDDMVADNEDVALMGPLDEGIQSEVWGLDIGYMGDKYRLSTWSAAHDLLIVSDPREVYEVMSYCRGRAYTVNEGERNTQDIWLGAVNHASIVNGINGLLAMLADPEDDINDPPEGEVGGAGSSGVVSSDLFVGKIRFTTSGAVSGVDLNRVYSRPRPRRPVVSGDYVLELRDSTGSVLRAVPFAAVQPIINHSNDPDRSGSDADLPADFGFVVSNPPDYASFAITRDDTVLLVRERSVNAPTVSVSGVSAGQMFSHADSISLSWAGADGDGDSLTYKVYYSIDAGRSYEPLMLETTSTSTTVQASRLLGSDMARFAVSVSDGLRSGFAESAVFRVAKHAPEVQIESPSSGAVLADSQGFVLEASGYDKEDGLLGFNAFSWASSVDGNLGAGRFIVVSADQLTSGAQTITVTATDSTGLTATATVNITVTPRNTVPTAVNDIVTAELDIPVFIDVLANDIDIERDMDRRSFEITVAPMLGEADIAMLPATGDLVVRYVGHTSGNDSLEYQICDGIGRCDTATVSIAVGLASCTIIGTEGDDMLVGTPGDDVICGLGGNDTIDGQQGADTILGGEGNDTLHGRLGNDIIRGGLGDDQILGHRGNDNLQGGLGNDEIHGGEGNDTIDGGPGDDQLHGEDDNDTIHGGEGNDTLGGGRGDDALNGGPGADTIRGNAGADTIHNEQGIDMILGTEPEDSIINLP